MRITWLFGASVITLAFFGGGLLAVPAWLLGMYGLQMTQDGELVARVLGAQALGVGVLEWYALRGGRELRVAAVRGAFVAEVASLAITTIAAIQGRGNTLFLSVVAIFLVFSVWRGYYLITYGRAAAAEPAGSPARA